MNDQVATDSPVLFGQKAIEGAFITEAELEECLALQEKIRKKKGSAPRIGEILVHQGCMTKAQVVQVLRGKTQIEGKFGEIAVALELVSTEERDGCLKTQNQMRQGGTRRPLPLGQLMVQQGLIRPNAILKILSFQSKTVARCPKCSSAYNIEQFKPGAFNCSIDGEVLEEVRDLEAMSPLADKEPTRKSIKPLIPMSPGEEFGRYKITRKLGSNPMGDCYHAYETEKERDVVLRVFEPVRTLDANYTERLKSSVERAIALSHENLRRVIMFAKNRHGFFYASMEFVDGSSLREILLEKGSLPYPQVLSIVKQVASALRYGEEKGLRHGDLRPANILISGNHATVLDLGIPADPKEMFHAHRSDQEIPGFYIAPEVVLNAEEVDARADIFSLGCIFYHALCGKAPFRGRSTVEILNQMTKLGVPPLRANSPHTPTEACSLVDTMLSIESTGRPAGWDALLEALEGLPEEAKRPTLGGVDYATFLGEDVGQIGDDEIEKARFLSMRHKRPTRKKKAKRPEDEMSYSQLIESMRAGGEEEAPPPTESKRATLEDLEKKKPVSRHAPIQSGGLRIKSTPFWAGVLGVLSLGAVAFGIVAIRSRDEWGRSRDHFAAQGEADRAATREREEEQKRSEEARSARDAQRRFELDSQVLLQFHGGPLDPGSIQSILVLVHEAYAQRSAGEVSGDLEMVLGRAHFLQVASDEFQAAEKETRQAWIAEARAHLTKAVAAYAADDAVTLVKQDAVSPDGTANLDLRLRLADGALDRKLYARAAVPWFLPEVSVVDYRGDAALGQKDAEFLLESLEELVTALGE